MIRTQLQLTPEQAAALKRAAASQDVSMAEVIRQLIDAHLVEGPGAQAHAKALTVVGKYRSGWPDTSTEHDAALADAFAR
jgi:hypothetical protein